MTHRQLIYRGATRVRGIDGWWYRVPVELKQWFGGRLTTGIGRYWASLDGKEDYYAMWRPERGDMLFLVRSYWYPHQGTLVFYLLRRFNGQRVYIECLVDLDRSSYVTVHEPGEVPEDL